MSDTTDLILEERGRLDAEIARLQKRMDTVTASLMEARRKRDAVEIVLRDVLGVESTGSDRAVESPSKAVYLKAHRRRGASRASPSSSVSAAVRSVAPKMRGVWTAEDLANAIKAEFPANHSDVSEDAVRKAVARLARDEALIEVVRHGTGPNPSMYSTVTQQQPTDGAAAATDGPTANAPTDSSQQHTANTPITVRMDDPF
ncbi:MAG: hypothetical protein AAF356_11700 [Planctomycetota bacterium]